MTATVILTPTEQFVFVGSERRELSDPVDRGASVGCYLALERLGAGAMGVVYAAYDPELDRKAAIKVLRPQERHGEWVPQTSRLQREARALARKPKMVDSGLVSLTWITDSIKHVDASTDQFVSSTKVSVSGCRRRANHCHEPDGWDRAIRFKREIVPVPVEAPEPQSRGARA